MPVSAGALIGRADEMALIQTSLSDPGVAAVVLTGEAGVGKTRIAREAVSAAAQAGESTYWVAGAAASEAIPFGAVTHLLPPGVTGRDRFAVLQAVTQALREAPRRPVVGVDDAHRLDEASAALLHHVAITRTASVIATVRAGERVPEQVAGLWKDGVGTRFEVRALERHEAAALVTELLGGPVDALTEDQMWRLTKGNPLYLRELVLGGQEAGSWVAGDGVWTWPGRVGTSGRIVELITDRIDRQPPPLRELVDLVAFGEPLAVTLLEAAGVEVATISAGETAALVRTESSPGGVQVRLAHPLFGESVRARCSPLRRREISRVLARAAAGIDAPGDALRVAVWNLDGGVQVPAPVFLSASARALGALDLALGNRLAAAAVDAGGGPAAEGMLARAQVLCGQFAQAETLLAAVLARDLPDLVRADFAALRAWNLSQGLGRPGDADAVLEAAAAQVTEGRDVVLGQAAHLSAARGKPLEGCVSATAVIDDPAARPDGLLRALISRAQCLSMIGRFEDCHADVERAHILYDQIHGQGWSNAWEELVSAEWFGRYYAGDLDGAEALVERELAVRRAAGWRVGTAWWTLWKGAALLARGAVHGALEEFRGGAILIAHETHPHGRMITRMTRLYQAVSASMVGELDEADAALAQADELAGAQIAATDVRSGRVHSWVLVAHGRIEEAIELACRTADHAEAAGLHGWEILARHQAVRLGAPEAVLDRLVALEGIVDGHLAPLYAAHALALARHDGAGLEVVADRFDALGFGLLSAEAAAQAASAHRHAHSGRAAKAGLRAAQLAARCQGARTPALALLTGPTEQLTARESQIARLAAKGLTNRAIGDQLVVSVRTVDNTLAKVYTKLGINSRDELCGFFA